MAKKPPVYWIGTPPTYCEMTRVKILNQFVDGPCYGIRGGPWAIMHPAYFERRGGIFAQGRGQLYELQADGRWLKIKG